MISGILVTLTLVYLALMVAALWKRKQRPALAIRVWGAAFVVALALTALNIAADRPWWLAALWALNAALDVLNVYLARQRQIADEADELYTA